MPNLLESTARTITDSLKGVDTEDSRARDERGGKLIKQLATGGLALGTGVSAVVALLNHMKTMKQEEEYEDSSRLNDDTLYMKAPKSQEKVAGVSPWLAPGVGLVGGVLAGGAAYALTQKIYNFAEKKRLQKKLDEAQGEALLAADEELAKSASEGKVKMDGWDLTMGGAVGIPLLAALASAGVSYAALAKAFPTIKSPKSKNPKRIRMVESDGDIVDTEEVEKSASQEAHLDAAAYEFLMITADSLAMSKSANYSITSDLLNRAAKDGIRGLESTYADAGLMGLSASVEGASASPATLENKLMGAVLLSKSASLAPIVGAVAAAEFQDMLPAVTGIVGSNTAPGNVEGLTKLAAHLHLVMNRPTLLEKAANINPELLDEAVDAEDIQQAMTSDGTGFASEEIDGENQEVTDGENIEEAADEGDIVNNEEDVIDQLLIPDDDYERTEEI